MFANKQDNSKTTCYQSFEGNSKADFEHFALKKLQESEIVTQVLKSAFQNI